MLKYKTTILKFNKQGEKTGWTYIEVPADIAQRLKKGNKKSFRVKGKLDQFPILQIALLPMGNGNFIMPLNAAMRKGIGKKHGAMLNVQLEEDKEPLKLSRDLLACLAEEPESREFFNSLPKSHQNYFSKWIESVKSDALRAKRIAMALNAFSKRQRFDQMLREVRKLPTNQ